MATKCLAHFLWGGGGGERSDGEGATKGANSLPFSQLKNEIYTPKRGGGGGGMGGSNKGC